MAYFVSGAFWEPEGKHFPSPYVPVPITIGINGIRIRIEIRNWNWKYSLDSVESWVKPRLNLSSSYFRLNLWLPQTGISWPALKKKTAERCYLCVRSETPSKSYWSVHCSILFFLNCTSLLISFMSLTNSGDSFISAELLKVDGYQSESSIKKWIANNQLAIIRHGSLWDPQSQGKSRQSH